MASLIGLSNPRNNENTFSLSTLLALADTVTATEAKKEFNIELIPVGSIRDALIEIKAEENKLAVREAAKDIYVLLNAKKMAVMQAVAAIGRARAEIVKLKSQLDALDACEKSGAATMNYLPLYRQLGYNISFYGMTAEQQALFSPPTPIVKKSTVRK